MDHIGIDVHKRDSQIYILAENGEIIERRCGLTTPMDSGRIAAQWQRRYTRCAKGGKTPAVTENGSYVAYDRNASTKRLPSHRHELRRKMRHHQ
jgi:hypothetical protein